MGELRVLDRTGDTKLIWDTDKQDEVDAAEAMFNKLTKKGYLAYTVKKGGKKGEQVKKFDPELEKIILSPVVVGG